MTHVNSRQHLQSQSTSAKSPPGKPGWSPGGRRSKRHKLAKFSPIRFVGSILQQSDQAWFQLKLVSQALQVVLQRSDPCTESSKLGDASLKILNHVP